MLIRRWLLSHDDGLYTVEGAFTIVIFAALIMMLLSIITIIGVEVEVQSGINQTAMQLSQYAYAVGDEVEIDKEETSKIKEIISDVAREYLGQKIGSSICKTLTESRINEKVLAEIVGGFDGIDFSKSSVLSNGEDVSVVAIYKIKVNTFGLVQKELNICQISKTKAWLPYNSSELFAESSSSGSSSIWHETNFTRGQYFIKQEKEKQEEYSVASGQGIDLYFKTKGKAVEIFSINVFSSSYSKSNGNELDPDSYFPNEEELTKQLDGYVSDFKKDIKKAGNEIEMESGSKEEFSVKEKEIILILPVEAESSTAIKTFLNSYIKSVKENDGIIISLSYCEEAL